MNNIEIVQRLYLAFRERDLDTLRAILHPEIEWIQNEGFPGGGRYVGAETVFTEVFAKFRVEWESWRAVVNEWLDAGDTIVALGEYQGRYRATGRDVVAAFAHVYRLHEGRIVRFQQYTDTAMLAYAMQPEGVGI